MSRWLKRAWFRLCWWLFPWRRKGRAKVPIRKGDLVYRNHDGSFEPAKGAETPVGVVVGFPADGKPGEAYVFLFGHGLGQDRAGDKGA